METIEKQKNFQHLQKRARKLDCSVPLIAYIELLERRITRLEEINELKFISSNNNP